MYKYCIIPGSKKVATQKWLCEKGQFDCIYLCFLDLPTGPVTAPSNYDVKVNFSNWTAIATNIVEVAATIYMLVCGVNISKPRLYVDEVCHIFKILN